MKTLKELRQLRATKTTRGKAALEELKALQAKTELTAEEATKLEALEAELTVLEEEVKTFDAQITALEVEQRRQASFAPRAAGQGARSFDPNPELTGGFKSIAHFAAAVVGQQTGSPIQLDAAASNYMLNQGSAGEGYLVPTEFSNKVWDFATADTDLWGLCQAEPTQSNSVFKPKDETTPWGATGLQAAWRGEAAAMTATKLAMTGELMQLHELYVFCSASSELLADAPMLEDRLGRQAGRAISWKLSDAVMWGDGVGKPTGFMNAPSKIQVAKDSGQASATLSVTNLGNMLAHMLRTGGTPVWVANQDILPQLIGLSIGNVPVFVPLNQGLQASPWDGFILGYPVKWTEHAQTLGTTGDIALCNFDGYYAVNKQRDAGGLDFASSMHLYFDQNLTAFRWTFRAAGQPYLSAAVSPNKGSTTKSHFIALQTR